MDELGKSGGAAPERCAGRLVVFNVLVLMVNFLVLVDVEPPEPDRAVQTHVGK
jgi:hypothetical protein